MTSSPSPSPLVAHGLRKRYGDTLALDGFDLEVAPGTVHALLGPNGAGKSTAVNTFATLTRCDDGEALVAGHDVRRTPRAGAGSRSGWSGRAPRSTRCSAAARTSSCSADCTTSRRPTPGARADELLELFGLAEAADRKVATYSGGMRRRLDIAAGLITRPACSSSTSPPPASTRADATRSGRWSATWWRPGTTVLLTTQYLDEADQLADRVTVMDAGRVIAEGIAGRAQGPPRRRPGDRHRVRRRPTWSRLRDVLDGVGRPRAPRGHRRGRRDRRHGRADRRRPVPRRAGIDVDDVLLRRPTLDEVFLHLTADQPAHDRRSRPMTTARRPLRAQLGDHPARPQALAARAVDARSSGSRSRSCCCWSSATSSAARSSCREAATTCLPAARDVRAVDDVRHRDHDGARSPTTPRRASPTGSDRCR